MDHELQTELLASSICSNVRRVDAAYALARWQHFSAWNDVMAAILNVRHYPTPSIDTYLLEEQSCHISSPSDLRWRSFRLLEDGHQNGATENAGPENGGPSKRQGWKMQDWKMWDHMTGLENVGLENVGPYDRAGKCRTGKWRTKWKKKR